MRYCLWNAGWGNLPDGGEARVTFDGSIIADTAVEKLWDIDEVSAGFMWPWEYCCKCI